QFNSTSEEKVTVRVLDMTGRLVLEQYTETVKDINELPIVLTGLQAGVYSMTVSNSTGVSAPMRFVKE
ncbi:MAG: T9SS type A sorting domain-containing protein, partial [Saprospiraceae bacterium]|nr:T9SS type A sorting domain-containing protein [Saprospiraceae bacterium]